MPALSHVMASLKGNTLTLSGTDLEVSVENKLQVGGIEDGKALLPARKLLDLLRELPDVTITISITKSNRITVTDPEKKEYKYSGEGIENYPRDSANG